MNLLDFVVLVGSMAGIAAYGVWKTRGRQGLEPLSEGRRTNGLGRHRPLGHGHPGQRDHVSFDARPGLPGRPRVRAELLRCPAALIVIAAVFLPMYRRLNVYTAYEFLGRRFDAKTRLLGAALFLLQRGLQAGITVYAPAIILSTVLRWRTDATILLRGWW